MWLGAERPLACDKAGAARMRRVMLIATLIRRMAVGIAAYSIEEERQRKR